MKSDLLMHAVVKALLESMVMERIDILVALGFNLKGRNFQKISRARNTRISVFRYMPSSARMLRTSGYANRTVFVPAVSPRQKPGKRNGSRK